MQEYTFKWEYWMMYILAKRKALFYTPPAKQFQSWLTHWSLQGGEEHRLHEYNSELHGNKSTAAHVLKGMTKTPFTKTPPTLAGDFWSNLQMHWACVACKRWFHRYIYAHTNLYLVYSTDIDDAWVNACSCLLILHCKGMDRLILVVEFRDSVDVGLFWYGRQMHETICVPDLLIQLILTTEHLWGSNFFTINIRDPCR